LIRIDKRIARNLTRLFSLLMGILIGVVSLLSILNIWRVSGIWQTLNFLLRYPLVRVQDTHVTPLSLTQLVIAVATAIWLQGWLKRQLTDILYPLLKLSPSNQYAANTVIGYTIVILGLLLGLQWMGIGLGGLAVFAGVVGIGVGFGLQNIANNFISGLLIIFGRPIAVGDIIEVENTVGTVREITTRSVTVETPDGRIVLIPNSTILTSRVINWSLGPQYVWVRLEVGVAYGSSVERVKEILFQIGKQHPLVLKNPEPLVRFNNFGANSLDFALAIAVDDPTKRFGILSDLRFSIDQRFKEEGIVIAFPQQDIHLDPPLQEAIIKLVEAYTQGKATPPQAPTSKEEAGGSKA
jgi:small-conductance mechanosensitive channel